MPRPPKPTYRVPPPGRGHPYWVTRAFGEWSETSGRRLGVRNYEIGPPTGRNGAANRRAAQAWVDGLAEERADNLQRADNPSLNRLVESYLSWSAQSRELITLNHYRDRLKLFCQFSGGGHPYGKRAVGELQASDLARFVKWMKGRGSAPSYTNSIVQTVMALLNWAVSPVEDRPGELAERVLESNPFAGVARPKSVAPPKRYCGPEARASFLRYAQRAACSHRVGTMARRFDRLAVVMLKFCEATGCRPSEACRLEWRHIDWPAEMAVLKGKSTHRTGRQRVLPLPGAIIRYLRAIERLPGRHDRFVFTHMANRQKVELAGVPWTAAALGLKVRRWRSEAIAAGLPIEATGPAALTLYAFRRDLGSDVLRSGGSYSDVAEVLGNSAAVAERHYASHSSSHAVNLAKAVAERRKKSGGA